MPLPTLSSAPAASSQSTPSPSPAAAPSRLSAWLARLGVNAEGRRWAAVGLLLLLAGLLLLAWANLYAKKPAPGVLPDAPADAAVSAAPAPAIPLAIKAPAEGMVPPPPGSAPHATATGVAGTLTPEPRPGLPAEVLPGAPPISAAGPSPVATPVPAQAASLAADLKALLEQQQRQAERIEHLEQQLGQQLAGVTTQLTRLQAQRSAAARAVRHAAATAAALPASAPASAPAPARAQLLSVDLWDGKPSVVIGTDAAGDRRVRFLSEGDRQSDIAVKQASPQDQRAVFDVAGREVVLERGSAR
jgi:hypothetical protein